MTISLVINVDNQLKATTEYSFILKWAHTGHHTADQFWKVGPHFRHEYRNWIMKLIYIKIVKNLQCKSILTWTSSLEQYCRLLQMKYSLSNKYHPDHRVGFICIPFFPNLPLNTPLNQINYKTSSFTANKYQYT